MWPRPDSITFAGGPPANAHLQGREGWKRCRETGLGGTGHERLSCCTVSGACCASSCSQSWRQRPPPGGGAAAACRPCSRGRSRWRWGCRGRRRVLVRIVICARSWWAGRCVWRGGRQARVGAGAGLGLRRTNAVGGAVLLAALLAGRRLQQGCAAGAGAFGTSCRGGWGGAGWALVLAAAAEVDDLGGSGSTLQRGVRTRAGRHRAW